MHGYIVESTLDSTKEVSITKQNLIPYQILFYYCFSMPNQLIQHSSSASLEQLKFVLVPSCSPSPYATFSSVLISGAVAMLTIL